MRRLDPMYRATFADGSTIYVRAGRAAMAEEIRATCGATEAAGFERFVDWLTELYRLELPTYIDRNYTSALDLARPLGAAVRLLRLGGLRRMAATVGDYFRDERLRRLFS